MIMDYILLGLLILTLGMLSFILYAIIRKNQSKTPDILREEIQNLYLKMIEKNQENYEKTAELLNKNQVESLKNNNEETFKLNKTLSDALVLHFDKSVKEIQDLKENNIRSLSENKEKLNQNLNELNLSIVRQLNNTNDETKKQFLSFQEKMQENFTSNMDKINQKVEERLNDGFKKTNDTFTNVLERLAKIDQAQKEIENLSNNVLSLQDVLQDKKSRGTFGEVQLENLIEKIFGANNTKVYERQYKLENGNICDMALKLPEPNNIVCIDSKFPFENYQRMIDRNYTEQERKEFTKMFKSDCKKHIDDIAKKYIIEGFTSDYALMFLPAEAVFAEINAYHPDIIDYSYSKRVFLTGPTTIMASLTSIQILLRDLERDKQAKIVNDHLKALGVEFGRFKDRWDKLKKNIDTVGKQAEDVYVTTEKINSKFNKISNVEVEEIEATEVKILN